jgi:hypothetical protein
MTFSRGDVVLLDFPFSGGGGAKTRPALVIQNDRDNRRLSNVIVAMSTRRTDRAGLVTTQLFLDICFRQRCFMTMTVTLDDKAARALDVLRQQALARGISLERYLSDLAMSGQRGPETASRSPHDLTHAEFRQSLTDLSAGLPPLPPIPANLSRADLYDDHD